MSNSPDNLKSMDPELAALLEDTYTSDEIPDYSSLFEESDDKPDREKPVEDLTQLEFPEVTVFEQKPDPVFSDANYYSNVLTGEGDIAQQFHSQLQLYLKEQDPQTKGVYRQRVIQSWWNLIIQIAGRFRKSSVEKQWALRYGYLLPTLVSAEQRAMLARIITKNEYNEPIHYLDEWLTLLMDGHVNPLASDEVGQVKRTPGKRIKKELSDAEGKKDSLLSLLNNFLLRRKELETRLETDVQVLLTHNFVPDLEGVEEAYREDQRKAIYTMMQILRELERLNQDIKGNIEKIIDLKQKIRTMNTQVEASDEESEIDIQLIESEMNNIKQLIKLCVGRQGNHFPFLMKSFFVSDMQMLATRENVIRCMKEIEKIDESLFKRTFKRQTLRIVPHTIILPCYGNYGVCWEPFELRNRATSRGRIAIPLFPRDLKIAIIYALADLRWTVAKERAAQYWMTEGLTGEYYQYFTESGGKGDVKIQFQSDYLLWITKEVEGVQKLEREARNLFWRFIPFPQHIKDVLRNRGFVYNELYKKDMNRSISDGY
ncbi:MAG: hypothetical protein B0D92_01720 [Spirochaeta sp. LUC14_002_19_P3]|nr:MAG: hypothetical protein B0D92_01720 [Spirochaeta sp. LUC14_002_19_P3]